MKNYLKQLLERIEADGCNLINDLIREQIINLEDIYAELINLGYEEKYSLINTAIKNINGLSAEKLVKYVISTNDLIFMFNIAKNVNDIPLEEIEDMVILLGSGVLICIFTEQVENTSVERMADKVIAIQDSELIWQFAVQVKGAPIEKLAKAIISLQDTGSIYKFAANVVGAPIKELAEATITFGSATDMYDFARDIKMAPIKKLAEGIMLTENAGEISSLIVYISRNIEEEYLIKNSLLYGDTKEELPESLKDTLIKKLALRLVELNAYENIIDLILKNIYPDYLTDLVIKSSNITYMNNLLKQTDNVAIKAKLLTKLGNLCSLEENFNQMDDSLRFEFLVGLYQNGDIKTISKYREQFATLFTNLDNNPSKIR